MNVRFHLTSGILLGTLWVVPLLGGQRSGADFLKIPVSARNAGLGQGATAFDGEAEALERNPAGIVSLSGFGSNMGSLALSHETLFTDTHLDHLALAMPARWGAAGVSVTRLSYPRIEGRSTDGAPTDSFDSSDLMMGGALATRVGPLRLGTQVKYIEQRLGDERAHGAAVDLGFLMPTRVSQLFLGGAVRNLGPRMAFSSDRYDLPLSLSVGASWRFSSLISVGADVQSRPHQGTAGLGLGSEFQATRTVTLRTGYLSPRLGNVETSAGNGNGPILGLEGLAWGLGVHFNFASLDYAMQPFEDLGNTHILTLSSRFGTRSPLPEVPAAVSKPAVAPDSGRQILILDLAPSTLPLSNPE